MTQKTKNAEELQKILGLEVGEDSDDEVETITWPEKTDTKAPRKANVPANVIAEAEEEYSESILEYLRVRRQVAEKCNKLQDLYDEAGIYIDLSEVVIGRA